MKDEKIEQRPVSSIRGFPDKKKALYESTAPKFPFASVLHERP